MNNNNRRSFLNNELFIPLAFVHQKDFIQYEESLNEGFYNYCNIVAKAVKDQGVVIYDDDDFESPTYKGKPLHEVICLNVHDNLDQWVLLKVIKGINDALNKVWFDDDSHIVTLDAYVTSSKNKTEGLTVFIEPANKDNCLQPDPETPFFTGWLRTVKSILINKSGHYKDLQKHKEDKKNIAELALDFAMAFDKINKPVALDAVITTAGARVSEPPTVLRMIKDREIQPASKPDCENLCYLIMRAMHAADLLKDCSLVREIHVSKVYSVQSKKEDFTHYINFRNI